MKKLIITIAFFSLLIVLFVNGVLAEEESKVISVGDKINEDFKPEDIQGEKVVFETDITGKILTGRVFFIEGGNLNIKGRVYKNIQGYDVESTELEPYVKMDNQGVVYEAQFTTNENGGTYVFANDIINVPPNTKVIFKNRKIILECPDGTVMPESLGSQDDKADYYDSVYPDNNIEIRGKNLALYEFEYLDDEVKHGVYFEDGVLRYSPKSKEYFIDAGDFCVINGVKVDLRGKTYEDRTFIGKGNPLLKEGIFSLKENRILFTLKIKSEQSYACFVTKRGKGTGPEISVVRTLSGEEKPISIGFNGFKGKDYNLFFASRQEEGHPVFTNKGYQEISASELLLKVSGDIRLTNAGKKYSVVDGRLKSSLFSRADKAYSSMTMHLDTNYDGMGFRRAGEGVTYGSIWDDFGYLSSYDLVIKGNSIAGLKLEYALKNDDSASSEPTAEITGVENAEERVEREEKELEAMRRVLAMLEAGEEKRQKEFASLVLKTESYSNWNKKVVVEEFLGHPVTTTPTFKGLSSKWISDQLIDLEKTTGKSKEKILEEWSNNPELVEAFNNLKDYSDRYRTYFIDASLTRATMFNPSHPIKNNLLAVKMLSTENKIGMLINPDNIILRGTYDGTNERPDKRYARLYGIDGAFYIENGKVYKSSFFLARDSEVTDPLIVRSVKNVLESHNIVTLVYPSSYGAGHYY